MLPRTSRGSPGSQGSIFAVALVAAAMLALPACSPRSTLPKAHATWVFGTDAPAFDPAGPPDIRRAALERLLTRGLVEEDSTGSVVPAAAESVSISSDSLVYTFRLRRGLAYVDGTPCGSEDFRAALIAGLTRGDHSTRRWQLAAVRGIDAVRAGRPLPAIGIEAPDPGTVRIRLTMPDPELLKKLALPGTSDAWRHRDARGWVAAIGLGPFRVLRGDSLHALTLVRARSAFERGDLADTLTTRFVPNAGRVRQLLRLGRPDLVWPLPPGLLTEPVPSGYRSIAQDPRPARWLLLVMRADVPPTTRLAARHALGHGVNRAEVARALSREAAEFGAWIEGATTFDFPRLDPQAIESWRERGKLGRSFHVVMTYDDNGPAAEVARALQGEWSAHAIYVELNPLVGAKRQAQMLGGQNQLALVDVQDLTTTPSALAAYVMPLRGPAVGAVRTGWRTREFDPWMAPSRRTPAWDPANVQRRFEDDRVVLPLARLRWSWVERADGPITPFHPHFGPECPSPSVPR